jgi:hypothetical protein
VSVVIQCDVCGKVDPGRGEWHSPKIPPAGWLTVGWHIEGDPDGDGRVQVCSPACLKGWAEGL